ncbi:hypothetical protein LAZ67_2001393 [Cordylochernes scorpioides]|uniref:RNA-directed DNA polymerase n=1 Tax=Cordylochernes scorpioides TaxID=51811 RepID=A0ABY6K1F7_9ARAC|nr:hypothetical protein LAZ67_2001393 [Cordylochernes scorpioides]
MSMLLYDFPMSRRHWLDWSSPMANQLDWRSLMEDPLDRLLHLDLALPQHQSEVVHSDDKFQVQLDVSNYRPEELSVKMVAVVVRGKQEKKDGHSWVSREFTRRYSLPPDVDPLALTSTLTPQGVLTLEAPKMEPPGDQAVEQMAVEDKSKDQYLKAVVLRGTTTPFLRVITQTACRMLERPRLTALPIVQFARRWEENINLPINIGWSSLRRCAFSGHNADVAVRLALHALSHPASAQLSCVACGSGDLSLVHRYWSCRYIRPLIREAFTIIGRPPDLQDWVFGHGLDNEALEILASAKTLIYRYFLGVELRSVQEDPLLVWRRTLSRYFNMAQIQPPETFDFSTPNEWPKWRKRFERYLVVSGMKKKEEADKIDLFMYLMGDRADDIFRTFKFEKEEMATKIDSVLKAFDSHFCVRKNIIYERAKFNSRIQEDREPVDEFITSLYKLSDSCEFEGRHEQLIRDRIVVGVRDKALSERMQLDSELTLEKAVNQKVNQVKFNSKKHSPKQQQQPSRKKEKSAKTRSRCPKCGGFTHREGQACRAEGQRCNLCSKTGHFANCCPDKQAKTAEVKAVSELDEEVDFLLEVSAVEDSSNLDVKFKLDSQADVTCVPLAAEVSELQTVGRFISTLRNGNYEIKEKIYVIRRLSEPLLSRRACELLNLARRIEVVATRINPIKEFPEVFEGLGQIGNPYEIKLKPGAKPYAVHTPRRVPIPLMEKLKTRLDILGKELLDADALSRQPLLATEGGENERPTSAHINAVLSSITDKDEMLTNIFEAQQEDTTLKAVVNYLEQGWPDKKMSQALLSYWHVKNELGVQNGQLMRSCRLVIPASMKLEILDKLHAGHFGITKTRLRARETVWWPGISEEIAETVRKCSVCIQEAVSKHEPLIPTNFPTRPWQKIGMDLFKFVIDYYSRFPEMIQLYRLTANVVVRSCKSIFARHGIPETVVSDNGTQFGAAREFANFARQYGFTHVTSSPRFPQSNGMAEAGVKIAKLILKKNQDPSLGLLEYRSTPLENGYSSAELLMGRKLRTTLPISPENLNPKLVDSQTLKRKEGRRRKDMKSRYDRRCGATDMEELSEDDTVWITDMRIWGIVKQKASTPRSYMVDTPVGTLRRNRFHLRKGDTVQYPADPSTPTFSGEELVENEKTPVVDYPSNDSEDGQIRTRSGRIVKPVDRLHY